jgi:5-carboxymethyl-2-hydroxymuconate isomerase
MEPIPAISGAAAARVLLELSGVRVRALMLKRQMMTDKKGKLMIKMGKSLRFVAGR